MSHQHHAGPDGLRVPTPRGEALRLEATVIPDWSGVWFESEEVGFLEISDFDERLHRPPEGWRLVDTDVCQVHSSQIFRYIRTDS
jgi:hypothetical protein